MNWHVGGKSSKNKTSPFSNLRLIWITNVATSTQVVWDWDLDPWVFYEIISSQPCNKTIGAMGKCLKAAGIKWI